MTIPQLSFVCLCLISFCQPLKAERVVVPPEAVGQEGSQSVGLFTGTDRILQRYAASQFIIPVNTFMRVESISFRLDSSVNWSIDRSLPHFHVEMSASSSAFSRNFQANHGGNQITVYDGPMRFQVTAPGQGNQDKPFNLTIPLTAPFIYDPLVGDLVLDLQNFQYVEGPTFLLDYLGTPLIKTVIAHGAPPGVFFGDEAYPAAGLPMEITYSLVQVPELNTFAFLFVGFIVLTIFETAKARVA